MTDRPNYMNEHGVIAPFTDDMMAQLAIDQAAIAQLAANPPVPNTISEGQFMQQLATEGDITWNDCFAYLATGTIPAIFATAISQIPIDVDPNAQNKAKARFIGANSFDRDNPEVVTLGALIGKSPAQLDAIWTAAYAIV